MADDTTTAAQNADYNAPAADMANISAGMEHLSKFGDGPEEITATARLRAFEDEHFGADAVRIHDRIERGSGSPYASSMPEVREQYEALEKLIVAEQKLADAHTALIAADADYEVALAATEPKPDAPE